MSADAPFSIKLKRLVGANLFEALSSLNVTRISTYNRASFGF